MLEELQSRQTVAGKNKAASLCTFTTARPTLYEIINKANLHEPGQRARRFTAEWKHKRALERAEQKVKEVDPAALREAAVTAGGGGSSLTWRRQTTAGKRKVVGTTSRGSRSTATHAKPP